MPTKAELMREIESIMSGETVDVILTPEQEQLLLENPAAIGSIWSETKQATLLNYWPTILSGQIKKALSGDTAAAKWVADLIEPDVQLERKIEPASWEQPAIELRDKLALEISAENLVTLILNQLLALTPSRIRSLLHLQHTP